MATVDPCPNCSQDHAPTVACYTGLVNTLDPYGLAVCRSQYPSHDFVVGPTHAICNRCALVVTFTPTHLEACDLDEDCACR